MRFIADYISGRIRVIAYFAVSALIFAVVFRIYGLPAEAVAYPIALSAVVGVLFMAVDIVRAASRRRSMNECKRAAEKAPPAELPALIGLLPPPTGDGCRDYDELLRIVCESAKNAEAQSSARISETEEFYTAWAHEIKTPISSVKLAIRDEDTEISRRVSEEMVKIEQCVDTVMAYVRLDSDSTDYVFRRCRLDSVVRQSVKPFSTQFIRRRIGLEYEKTDAEVVTDEKWLSFVLEQLLSNALKYTKSGRIKIAVCETDGGVSLSVADTGVGIAQDDLPRIFEKGYTGKNGRAGGGASGIGLWLCARVCRALSCDIGADSTLGEGTTVTIVFHRDRSFSECDKNVSSM